MMCPNCSKLAFLYTKKRCIHCQGEVVVSIAILCERCSLTKKQCSVCLKKTAATVTPRRGCGCGGK